MIKFLFCSLPCVAFLTVIAPFASLAQSAPDATAEVSATTATAPAAAPAPASEPSQPSDSAATTADAAAPVAGAEATAQQVGSSVTPGPAAAQPKSPQIPADVFWVSRRVSVPIEGGLLGLEAGDEVRVLKQEGMKWTAMNEKGVFEIDSYVLIKDPVVAAQLRASAAQNNAAAQAAAAAAARAAEALEMKRRMEFEQTRRDQVLPANTLTGESRLKEPPKR